MYILHVVLGAIYGCVYIIGTEKGGSTFYIPPFFSTLYRDGTEKAMAPHSSTLAWKTPWTEEPGRLQSIGSLRVRHD